MNHDLAVAVGREPVAASAQIFSQSLEAIDLAVADGPNGPVLVRDRLMAAGEIDDRQAPHADQHAAAHVFAGVVRTAMARHVAHALEQAAVELAAVEGQDSVDPAHSAYRSLPGTRSTISRGSARRAGRSLA